MNFTERLHDVQRKNNSLLCIGLDTDSRKLPPSLARYENPVLEFNKRIIEATRDLVCAYKINLAFYEAESDLGIGTLRPTLRLIPRDILSIGDAKRGDIGNSSARYAHEMLEVLNFDSSTVNPYMGTDSVEPFLTWPEKGTFILAVTSNPGAKDFQYLPVKGKPLYEHVVRKVKKWNVRNNCGLVVGATRPKELQRVRSIVPDMPLLIPGVGSQGGDLAATIRYGCNKRGYLAVINASRSVIYASSKEDFAEAARKEALALRDEINRLREKYF
jgi:orotidine-5'-phosphate decarboxylase